MGRLLHPVGDFGEVGYDGIKMYLFISHLLLILFLTFLKYDLNLKNKNKSRNGFTITFPVPALCPMGRVIHTTIWGERERERLHVKKKS